MQLRRARFLSLPSTIHQRASGMLVRLLASRFGWDLGENLPADAVYEEASNGDSIRALVS